MNVIFDQIRSFCQISIAFVAIIFLSACAAKRDAAPQIQPLEIKPVYNGLQPNTREPRPDGTLETHLFFDPAPFGHPDDRSVNVVVITPAESVHGYELDTKSGALYWSRYHCKHKDIWGKYGDTLSTPPFSITIVPRMLDALGDPQEAFVFGDAKYWQERTSKSLAHRVRIVGGVIRQVCRDYPCVTRERWLSNMQLIAVNPSDPKFAKVQDLNQLKELVDWNESIAWMQNGFGVTLAGTRPEPVYRVTGEVDAAKALAYFLKKNRQINFEEQKSIVKSCNILYEDLWQGAKRVRSAMEKKQKEVGEGKDGTKALIVEYSDLERLNLNREQRQIDMTNRKLDLKKEKDEYDFSKLFANFHKNYGKRYKTCSRFVRPASLVQNPERFWFFSHVDLFMGLEDLGWSYRCSRKAWLENPRRADGKRTFENNFEKYCTTDELDGAFDMAVTVMSGERNAKRPHMRFISYDSGANGSHQKIYGWVNVDGKELVCSDKDEVKLLEQMKMTMFPSDISWKSFKLEKRRSRFDIIK
tara:strand:- start:69626 stop:71209 length:1584 start_codon:yes stop_codon:yes gene_type:complete